MVDWRESLVAPDLSVVETMQVINASKAKIALVVDGNERLIGAVTDGDIRRGLLRGLQLTAPISEVCNPSPRIATCDDSRERIRSIMKKELVRQVPIVDQDGRVVGLYTSDELVLQAGSERDVWVVLMAGGQGKRLRPLTEEVPKPMLLVGDKPLLETILENLIDQGFRNFFFSVHYKADAIESHFGDGAKWGVQIRYLHEKSPMGTAGALSLLPEPPSEPVIIMNGDLLTKVNFGHMLDYHIAQNARATMGVREYDIKIEFGVVQIQNDQIVALKEKPVHQFLVNAGIYILEPDVLKVLSSEGQTDMPAVFQTLIDAGAKCSVFPIVEYWLDIGRQKDFEHAKNVITSL